LTPADFQAVCDPIGRTARERTTFYGLSPHSEGAVSV